MRAFTATPFVLAIVLAAQAGSFPTAAAVLTLNEAGAFGVNSTLGGVAFGANPSFTSYSYSAVFDTASPTLIEQGKALFDITSLTIDITGHGVYTAGDLADLRVLLVDQSFGAGGTYAAGIVEPSLDHGFAPTFNDSTSAFDAAAPTPTTFSNNFNPDAALPFTITLIGGAGPLVVNDFVGPFEASITAVPEPSSLVLFGLSVGGGLAHRRRRRAPRSGQKSNPHGTDGIAS